MSHPKQICKQCKTQFEVIPKDLEFYKKMNVPAPAHCPDCRVQMRLAWRNERRLFTRKCDLSGKQTISFYPQNSQYKVYAQDVWWSDKWDGKDYGRDFDFNRPFFDQFAELLADVPHMAMVISHGENSDYCPYAVYYKNSYMCVSGVKGEDIYYSFWTNDSRSCTDCYACFESELCYECVQCINLYNSFFCKDCDNSNDLAFCVNCDGCKNCIGCYGLRHKEYYVFNKKVTPQEYEKINKEIRESPEALLEMKAKFQQHLLNYPQRALQMVNTENCTGDYLLNCRNSHDCYLSEGLEDCAYMWNIPDGCKDCMDLNFSPKSELTYNSISTVNGSNCLVAPFCWDTKDSFYSFQCFYSGNLLGCVGLKKEKYCILNKQYSKEEYNRLVPRIIEHMKKTNEWGEFFPMEISPFGYNETIAQDYFPLLKHEVKKRGWRWSDEQPSVPKVEKTIIAAQIPANIKDVPDDIVNWAILCEESGKPFRIIPQELTFYRKMGLPIPRRHPNLRHAQRQASLNPRHLFNRNCDKCGAPMQTTFAPSRPETVYCEKCYLKEVY
ncbi:hypothetical protein KJ951_02330 [Patescibacteria group bacterium]|nr:hypothetical protein [Patescibacteria group bacterium]MBU1703218.1 hypothetical protein [Patescibacteria group bacterium]MBU1953751.1 hypothetical protein [Patescibacteria group bacterium]